MVLESIQLDGIYKLLQRPSPNKLIHSLFNQAYLFAVFDNTLYDSIVCIAIAPQQFNTGFWDSRVPPRFCYWVGFLLDSVRFLRDSRICFILIDSLILFFIICGRHLTDILEDIWMTFRRNFWGKHEGTRTLLSFIFPSYFEIFFNLLRSVESPKTSQDI